MATRAALPELAFQHRILPLARVLGLTFADTLLVGIFIAVIDRVFECRLLFDLTACTRPRQRGRFGWYRG